MSTKKYICPSCDESYDTFKEAKNCCYPKEMWECDNCNKRYNEKTNADMCCFDFG